RRAILPAQPFDHRGAERCPTLHLTILVRRGNTLLHQLPAVLLLGEPPVILFAALWMLLGTSALLVSQLQPFLLLRKRWHTGAIGLHARPLFAGACSLFVPLPKVPGLRKETLNEILCPRCELRRGDVARSHCENVLRFCQVQMGSKCL